MNLEWDVPFLLIPSVNYADTTPGLTALPFNAEIDVGTTALGIMLLDPSKCQAGSGRRITRSNLAQTDGEITHRKFKSGYVVELIAQMWLPGKTAPACAGALREMGDVLGGYLEAAANDDAQLVFFPSGWPDPDSPPNPRLLDRCRSLGPSGNDTTGSGFVAVAVEKDSEGPLTEVTFALLSPLPYLTDFMNYPTDPDETATFGTGVGDDIVTITNEGNTGYWPLIRVYGPADDFSIVNESVVDEIGNALRIDYDSSQIGALPIPDSSHYVEIDTFRNTVKLHLPGGGTDNAKSGIVVTTSDFFTLQPGDNRLLVTDWAFNPGSKVEIIYRNAWV